MRTIAALLLAGGVAAADKPPVQASLSKPAGESENRIAVTNTGTKTIVDVCFDSVYAEDGAIEKGAARLHFDCVNDINLAPKAKGSYKLCENYSEEMPKLSQLEIRYIKFDDKTVWHRTAPLPKKSVEPVVLTRTKLTYRQRPTDCAGKCRSQPVFRLQNVSKKTIHSLNFHFTEPTGKENHMAMGIEPLPPGGTMYLEIDGALKDWSGIYFDDDSKWETPAR